MCEAAARTSGEPHNKGDDGRNDDGRDKYEDTRSAAVELVLGNAVASLTIFTICDSSVSAPIRSDASRIRPFLDRSRCTFAPANFSTGMALR